MKTKRQARDTNLIAHTKRYIDLRPRVVASKKVYSRKKIKIDEKYCPND